jgi:hypothetical protein
MDLRITSSGRVFYQVDPTLAAILIEALPSVFERVNPRPQPAPQELVPQWGIGTHHLNGQVFVKFTLGTIRNETYFGHPKSLTNSTFGWPVPEAVLKEYERRWQSTTLTESEAKQAINYRLIARGIGDK